MSIDAQIWTFIALLLLIGAPPLVWNVIVSARRALRWLGFDITHRWWDAP